MDEDDEMVQINRLTKRVEHLERETAMFGMYLSQHGQDIDLTERTQKKRGRKRRQEASNLTIDQKLEISSTVLDEIHKETEETKKGSEKLIDTLKAVLEETDIRIAELRKDAYEFKRDIVVGAENFRTGKIMAEKVIRYMEEKLRQKDANIEKLKLKNATIKSQTSKLEQQLKQKEEMGDVLHYIDFHQLQIENKQNVAKIEQRNQELLKLKMTTGKIVQVLNSKKHELNEIMSQSEWLKREIEARKEQLDKVKDENKKVANTIIKKRGSNKKKRSQQEETSNDMPQILDYVKQKATMYELQAEVKNWTRKLEIAEIAGGRQGYR